MATYFETVGSTVTGVGLCEPKNVRMTGATAGSVSLGWDSVAGATAYRIESMPSSGVATHAPRQPSQSSSRQRSRVSSRQQTDSTDPASGSDANETWEPSDEEGDGGAVAVSPEGDGAVAADPEEGDAWVDTGVVATGTGCGQRA